jgi:hypothetical protein
MSNMLTYDQCCGSGMVYPDPDQTMISSRIRILKFFHPGSYMKSGMRTYFFLAPYAFRSKVSFLFMVKKILYLGSEKN